MFDRVFAWLDGFHAAALRSSQQEKGDWSPEILAAIISTGGAVAIGVIGIVGAIWGTKIGARANQAATLAAAGQLAEVERMRFVNERIWEERKSAYSRLLASLTEAGRCWLALGEGFSTHEKGPEGYYKSYEYELLKEEASKHWRGAYQVFDENLIVLSDEFVSRFFQLSEKMAGNCHDHDPPGEANAAQSAIRTAFQELFEISKADVRL